MYPPFCLATCSQGNYFEIHVIVYVNSNSASVMYVIFFDIMSVINSKADSIISRRYVFVFSFFIVIYYRLDIESSII